MTIYTSARTLIGYNRFSKTAEISLYVFTYLRDVINPINCLWSGYFAAAALSQAGLTVPTGYQYGQAWGGFGTKLEAPALDCIVVFPADEAGYSHIGMVTGFAAANTPTILVGDYQGYVVEQSFDLTGAVFRSVSGKTSIVGSHRAPVKTMQDALTFCDRNFIGINKQSTALVHALTDLGPVSTWVCGDNVIAHPPAPGTAIATFNYRNTAGPTYAPDTYTGQDTDACHCGIFVSGDGQGFYMLEQVIGMSTAVVTYYSIKHTGTLSAMNYYTII